MAVVTVAVATVPFVSVSLLSVSLVAAVGIAVGRLALAARRAAVTRSAGVRLGHRRARSSPPAADDPGPWTTGRHGLVVAVGAVAAVAVVIGPALAVVVALALVFGPKAARRLGAERAVDHYVEAVPEVLESVGRALRAGAATRRALAVAARGAPTALADDLGEVVRRAEQGVPLGAALERWATGTTVPGVGLAVAALTLAGEAGGDAARSVEGVAATLRDRVALRRELRALAAQARLSALVVAAAPLGFAVVTAAADPATARFLLSTPVGGACLVVGVGLDVAAWTWMDRITRSVA